MYADFTDMSELQSKKDLPFLKTNWTSETDVSDIQHLC